MWIAIALALRYDELKSRAGLRHRVKSMAVEYPTPYSAGPMKSRYHWLRGGDSLILTPSIGGGPQKPN